MESDTREWRPVLSLNSVYEVSDRGDIRRVFVQTKLSSEEVDKIRSLREAGRTIKSLSREFGVTRPAIRNVLKDPQVYSMRTPLRELKVQVRPDRRCCIRVSLNNRPRTVVLHRLVVEAFIGPIPHGMEVNHKNGNPSDNRIENLEIVTQMENYLHSVHVLGHKGDHPRARGSANAKAVLTESKVTEIRSLYAAGHTSYKKLAKQFGVSPRTISFILSRHTWAHCP